MTGRKERKIVFELLLFILMVITMARIADADGQSTIIWGAIALVLGIACVQFVPLVYGRILLAGVLTFISMTAYKVISNK
jgi:hypothetical protein